MILQTFAHAHFEDAVIINKYSFPEVLSDVSCVQQSTTIKLLSDVN